MHDSADNAYICIYILGTLSHRKNACVWKQWVNYMFVLLYEACFKISQHEDVSWIASDSMQKHTLPHWQKQEERGYTLHYGICMTYIYWLACSLLAGLLSTFSPLHGMHCMEACLLCMHVQPVVKLFKSYGPLHTVHVALCIMHNYVRNQLQPMTLYTLHP